MWATPVTTKNCTNNSTAAHQLVQALFLEVFLEGGLGLLAGREVVQQSVCDLRFCEKNHEVINTGGDGNELSEDICHHQEDGALCYEAIVEHALKNTLWKDTYLLGKNQGSYCTLCFSQLELKVCQISVLCDQGLTHNTKIAQHVP